MQQPNMPQHPIRVPIPMYGTHPQGRGTNIHGRQQQVPLGQLVVSGPGGPMLGTSASANMGLHQIQGRHQPDIILHPALFGPTVNSQRPIHPQVVPNVIPPDKRPSPSYLPALPPPPRSSHTGNPPIPQRGIPRGVPLGSGGIPANDPFIEEQVDMLAEKIESLEGELRYAWRALDVLSQEYVKMWQRLEKMEDLLSEQQTVITQLIDLYSVDNSGGSEDTGPENGGGHMRPLSSSPSHAIQSLAMDENFYKALNAMHASRSTDSTGGMNNNALAIIRSESGNSMLDSAEEDDEEFSSPGDKALPLSGKQGTFSDFLNEYDSLVKQQQRNKKGSKFGVLNGSQANGKQNKQKGTSHRRNRAIGSQGVSPDDSDIDINRSLGEDTSPSGRSDSTGLGTGKSSEQELGQFPLPSDLSPDYENSHLSPPPPKMPPPPPPKISALPPPLPSKGNKSTKKSKKQNTFELPQPTEITRSPSKERKSKKDKQKKNGTKRHSKSSPPDSRLPVGDGSSAEREAAMFMAALSSGKNIPQNLHQNISQNIPADRIYETYPRNKDREEGSKADLVKHTSGPLTLVGGKYSFTLAEQHGNGGTGGGLLDDDSFDARTAQPVANGKPLFTSMQTAMKPPTKLKTSSRHKNIDGDPNIQKQHRAHSIGGGSGDVEVGQVDESNYKSTGKRERKERNQSKNRSQSVSVDSERPQSSDFTTTSEALEQTEAVSQTTVPSAHSARPEANLATEASSNVSQQKQQSASRKLSIKEKRKLRAERELAPREIDVVPAPAVIPEVSTAPQAQMPPDVLSHSGLLQPPISTSSSSGGGPSPSSVKRLMDSSGDDDHSMRSEQTAAGMGGPQQTMLPAGGTPSAPEGNANGAAIALSQNNVKQRDRAGSREFAVSRALGKYREKQKQIGVSSPLSNKMAGSSNSDSQEDLDAASPTKTGSFSEENLPKLRPTSMGEESSAGEMIANTSSTTSTSGPDASTAPWPADKVEKGAKVSKSSSASDERLEDTNSSNKPALVGRDKEAKLEETLKSLDKKLAEIDGSLKPSSTKPKADIDQPEERCQVADKIEDNDYEEQNEQDMTADGYDAGLDEQEYYEEYQEEVQEAALVADSSNNLQNKQPPHAQKNKDVAEMTPEELQAAAEKTAEEAAKKAEKAATEAAKKTAKAATAAFSIFGATRFGKMATKAATQAAAQAKTVADQASASQQLAPPGSTSTGGSKINSRASSRVSSRRQSTEESIDSEDEWYRHEMRQLENEEYETEASKIKPPQEVNEQMNGVFNELAAMVKPVEKEECDKKEAARLAKQQEMKPKTPPPPPPPQTEEPVPSTSKDIGDHRKVIMRFESSDMDEDDDYGIDDDGAESDETSHDHARRKGVAKNDDSSDNDSDATQSGPDSLMDDSCEDRRRSSIDDMLSDQSGKKKGTASKQKSSLTSIKAIKETETDTQSSPSERDLRFQKSSGLPSQQTQSLDTIASSKESISSSQPHDSKHSRVTTSDESTNKQRSIVQKQITETSSKDSISSKSAAADSVTITEDKPSSESSKTSSKSSKRAISRKSITPTNARSPSGSTNGKATFAVAASDNPEQQHAPLEATSSWMNTGAYEYSPGYYDENGEWVEQSGFYDENGDWVETGGYYTEDTGEWIDYAGYYDDEGEWIDVEPPDTYYASLELFYANANADSTTNVTGEYTDPNAGVYYDDGGGGGLIDPGGGGVMESGLETLQEEVEGEEEATKSSETEEGTLNATQDKQKQTTAGHFLVTTGVVEPTNAINYNTQTTPGKNYNDYNIDQQQQFFQEQELCLDQYPTNKLHEQGDDTNDGLTTPDEMGDEYAIEEEWHDEEDLQYVNPLNNEDYIETYQEDEVKDDSGSGLHTINAKQEESQKSVEHDASESAKDVEKISLEKKDSEEKSATSENEMKEPSETLEEIIDKQKQNKGKGISAAARWKNLKQTINEKQNMVSNIFSGWYNFDDFIVEQYTTVMMSFFIPSNEK